MSAATTAIGERKRKLRERLWPDVSESCLWQSSSKGWVRVPRPLPLLLRIMDLLAPKGKPVSSTYLDLWCRTFNDSFVVVSNPRQMAYFSGFSGARAEHTWKTRIQILSDLGFIRYQAGPNYSVNYVLVLNPYDVVQGHIESGDLREETVNALTERMIEIGANDLDPVTPGASGEE